MNDVLNNLIDRNIQIVGQEFVLKYLLKRLETRELPKTMLFTGPQGVGKTTMAKYIALKKMNSLGLLTENDLKSILSGYSSSNIKLFNMATLTTEEEVEKVVAQFAKPMTGIKIIILDECHGMNTRQQDALLDRIDHMENNVYVIMCTTDNVKIRKPLLSRMELKLNFTKLSKTELRTICTNRLNQLSIQSSINRNKLISTLCLYANGDARALDKIINELNEMYVHGNKIDEDMMKVLTGDTSVYKILLILYMLEVNITQGLLAIDNIEVDYTFRDKCSRTISILNGCLEPFSKEEQELINGFKTRYLELYCSFLEEILEDELFDKNKLVGLFYKYHKEMEKYSSTEVNNNIKKQAIVNIINEDNAINEMSDLISESKEVESKPEQSFNQIQSQALNFE